MPFEVWLRDTSEECSVPLQKNETFGRRKVDHTGDERKIVNFHGNVLFSPLPRLPNGRNIISPLAQTGLIYPVKYGRNDFFASVVSLRQNSFLFSFKI